MLAPALPQLAFCAEAEARVTDEIVDLFDDGIAAQHAKARRALVPRKLDVADSANASVIPARRAAGDPLRSRDPRPARPQSVWQRNPGGAELALELAAEIKPGL